MNAYQIIALCHKILISHLLMHYLHRLLAHFYIRSLQLRLVTGQLGNFYRVLCRSETNSWFQNTRVRPISRATSWMPKWFCSQIHTVPSAPAWDNPGFAGMGPARGWVLYNGSIPNRVGKFGMISLHHPSIPKAQSKHKPLQMAAAQSGYSMGYIHRLIHMVKLSGIKICHM